MNTHTVRNLATGDEYTYHAHDMTARQALVCAYHYTHKNVNTWNYFERDAGIEISATGMHAMIGDLCVRLEIEQ